MKTIFIACLAFSMLVLCAIFVPLMAVGLEALSPEFLTSEPQAMGTQGGIGPVLVSTLAMNFMMITLVLLFGLPAAFRISKLSRSNSKLHTSFSTLIEMLASTPSIVFGLFGNAFFVVYLQLGYSIIAGSATLSLMVLPLFIRIMEDAFDQAQEEYGAICVSLGISEIRTAFRILFPAVLPAVAAALVLSWTRAAGETAALLVTSGYSTRWPESIFDSGRSLSVHIFDLSMNVGGGDSTAYKSAFVLLTLTLFFSFFSRIVMKVIFKWNFKTAL